MKLVTPTVNGQDAERSNLDIIQLGLALLSRQILSVDQDEIPNFQLRV